MVLKRKKLPAAVYGGQFEYMFKSPSCQVNACEAVVAAPGAAVHREVVVPDGV